MGFFNFFKKKIKNKTTELMAIPPKIKAGLALGSGGTRGFAHLGVLKAFEDEGISFDYIAGTSAGSIAGALYSRGYNSKQMIDFVSTLSIRDVKDSKFIFMPSSAKPLESLIKKFMGDIEFSDLKKPFACVAVDLISGSEVVIKEGDIAKAVSASCAVPPFFRPVQWGNMNLIDGAYANPIPASVVRDMGADVVVSVEVNSTRGIGTDSLSIVDVYKAATRIAMKSTADQGIANSDIMICPNLRDFKAMDIKGANEMIKLGYDCAYEHMRDIKELLGYSDLSINPKGAPEFQFYTK